MAHYHCLRQLSQGPDQRRCRPLTSGEIPTHHVRTQNRSAETNLGATFRLATGSGPDTISYLSPQRELVRSC